MKRILLLMLLCMFSTIAMAQTTWTGLGANTNWNNTDNWDTNAIPTASDDVIIPTGFTVTLNVPGTVQSIDVQGNATFNMNSSFSFAGDSNFDSNTTINWSSGTLLGSTFTLTNQGEINLIGNGGKSIVTGTILDNEGTINISSAGDLFINGGSTTLNNTVGGIIDLQSDAGNITWAAAPGVINNAGMIKKTISAGEAQISTTINNNDGVIQVEEGILSFQSSPKNFTDGTYNVFSGATLDWDVPITISGSLGGTLEGGMNWNSNITVITGESADLNFSENFNWTSGTLSGGGILTNNGSIALTGNSGKIMSGEVTVNNLGTITITSAGDLFINGTSTILNNQLGGVIDLQADAGNITWSAASGVINNIGMIKKTMSAGEAQIITTINNNDGVIQVEAGILSFQSSPKNFTDGTYNVFSGATLDWDVAATISGSLGGTLAGNMNWNSNITVIDGAPSDLNFSENFNWTSGTLSGGGILTNNGSIALTGNSGKIMSGEVTVNNLGTITITSAGDLFINGTSTILNNQLGGVIDLQADAGNITWSAASGILNNSGLLRRSESTGVVQIFVDLNNFGTIEVASGELEITNSRPFINETTGVVKGIGIFDLPTVANYTNNGIFAPGLSPGTLSVQGDFESTTDSQLEIELNGLTPDTEHDVLAITGNNNVFEGSVNVIMGFEGTVGDEFIIATTSGTITTANLESPIENVDFEGKRYTFEVSYPDDDKVVLTITDKLDILPPDVVTQNITVQLDASGNASILPSEIDNGSSDNCTPTNELQFSLDVDTFDCSNLGDNTVNLTVTDNDGNSASAPATVIVEDVINPSVVTQNITVQLDASGNASILPSEIDNGSSDNCSVADLSIDISEFTCSDLGDNTITLTVTDQSGNVASETAVVTVEDTTSPTVVTQNFTIQLDASGSASVLASEIDNGSSDNCSVVDLNLDISEFTCTDLGDNTVTLTVTDASGNTASETALVTVEDSSNPTAVTQNLTVQLDASGNAGILASEVDNGSSDNCSVADLSIDISEFTCADLGENTVTLTVTDQSGNVASETTTVTVEDTINPEISCPAGITIETTGDYEIPNFFIEGDVTASDNCGFTVEQNLIPGTLVPDGEYEVIMTVTDDAGNTSTCSFDLKVEDTTLSSEQFQLTDQNIVLYPNPVNNILYLKNKSALNLTEVEIFDVTGKIINKINAKAIADTVEISMVNLANGVYFLRINADNSTITKRIIKQ